MRLPYLNRIPLLQAHQVVKCCLRTALRENELDISQEVSFDEVFIDFSLKLTYPFLMHQCSARRLRGARWQ